MNPDDVARFLHENPAFFDDHAEVLAQITVPNPHGGSAIPLADKQVLSLREKYRALEAKLSELLQFGEENDAISEKMHRFALALLAAPGKEALFAAISLNLRDDFAVPHVALRIWGIPPRELETGADEYAMVSDELKNHAASMTQPYCGPRGNAEAAQLFGEAASQVHSMAIIPLREVIPGTGSGVCIGLLTLGSEDSERFFAEMGTLYLKRLGELVGAALTRFA